MYETSNHQDGEMADGQKNSNDIGDALPPLKVDWDMYAKYLDEADLSDSEKREFIETLWSIVVAFVDLGFGIHPVQQALEKSANERDEIAALLDSGMLSSTDNEQDKKSNCATPFSLAAKQQKRSRHGRK